MKSANIKITNLIKPIKGLESSHDAGNLISFSLDY